MTVDTVSAILLQTNFCRTKGAIATVAREAALIVRSAILLQWLVGFVTRKAGELSATVLLALALAQVDRLMSNIPRVAPVDGVCRRTWRPVAAATKLIECGAGQPLWIPDQLPRLLYVSLRRL
jgi:hypothetical protein